MGVTAVCLLPLLLLGISGLLFIYQEVSRLWSKSAVQNKVVVLTDAISGLGKGKLAPAALRPLPREGREGAGQRAANLLGGRGKSRLLCPLPGSVASGPAAVGPHACRRVELAASGPEPVSRHHLFLCSRGSRNFEMQSPWTEGCTNYEPRLGRRAESGAPLSTSWRIALLCFGKAR